MRRGKISSRDRCIGNMRLIAAEGSAGAGRLVATVNGYSALTGSIACRMLVERPRLGRLVMKTASCAMKEAERQVQQFRRSIWPLTRSYVGDRRSADQLARHEQGLGG